MSSYFKSFTKRLLVSEVFQKEVWSVIPFYMPVNCFSMVPVSVSAHLGVCLMSCKACGEPQQDKLKVILSDEGKNRK